MPPIEHNGPKFYYQVKYRQQNPAATEQWSTLQIEEWTTKQLTIPNQPTYKPYDIMVIAYNENGQSKAKTKVSTGNRCTRIRRKTTSAMKEGKAYF